MNELAEYYKSRIGEYWFENGYLDKKIASIPKGKSFIFLADPHRREGVGNLMRSSDIIGYIRAVSDIKKVIIGGDFLGRERFTHHAVFELEDNMRSFLDVVGEDLLVVMGNHDLNTANVPVELYKEHILPFREVERILMSHMDRVCEDVSQKIAYLGLKGDEREELLSASRLHFHIDDNDQKIRYIMLDTGVPPIGNCVADNFGVSYYNELILQYDWLYDTLMSTPKDYDVVVSAHHFIYHEKNDVFPVVSELCKMLSAFRAKGKVVVNNLKSDNEQLTKYYAAGEHEYDFSACRASGKLAVLTADVHWDVQRYLYFDENGRYVSKPYEGEVLSDTGIVVNVTQSDAFGCTYYERCYKMTADTNTEQCFDIVTICDDGNVRLTRIGAGVDRFVKVK